MSSTVRVIVPPLVVELEKCLAYILEVTEYKTIAGKERYLVSCRVKCGDKTSPVFSSMFNQMKSSYPSSR